MRIPIVLFLCSLPFWGFNQKFFVIEPDSRINERLSNRILKLGYSVVKERDRADFIAQMIYEKKHSYISFKTSYQKEGFVAFLNSKGDTLAKTETQGGNAWGYNTYTALSTLTNKILKTDFDEAVKTTVASYTPKEDKNNSAPTLSRADELTKLKKLLDDGVITREEFEKEKARILNQ
jgi:hypothetical protein